MDPGLGHTPAPDATVGAGHQARRWHAAVDHTADVGLRAAAVALAEVSADIDRTHEVRSEDVEIEARDLEQLVFRWLNDLIGLADVRGEALARTEVLSLEQNPAGWAVRGRAWFAPFHAIDIRPRVQVKAVTMHGLRVTRDPEGWSLEAYLDV